MKSFHQPASSSLRHLVAVAIAIAVIAVLGSLSGCASLDNAGHAAYSATAVKDANGNVTGYELSVKDGKEFAGRQIQFQANGAAVGLVIVEGESKAFKGQAIGAKALSVMPVTGLQDILK